MLLICMSIAGTVQLIIQRKKFSYRLGRNLVFLSLAGYLIPFQVVKYLMPTDVLIRTDALANISYYINFDDKGAISYHRISLWMSDWILMIGLCWLFLISGFSVYEIIKYHRLTRKLKKITEKRTLTWNRGCRIPYFSPYWFSLYYRFPEAFHCRAGEP